jgi:hypothetical protein
MMRHVLAMLFFIWIYSIGALLLLLNLDLGIHHDMLFGMIVVMGITVLVADLLKECRILSATGGIEPYGVHLLVSSRWLLCTWVGLIILGIFGADIISWIIGRDLPLKTAFATEMSATLAATALALVSFAVRCGQQKLSQAS